MSASTHKTVKVEFSNYDLGELLSQVHINDLVEVFKYAGIENPNTPSNAELEGRIEARLVNLWAEQKNCEFKHSDPDCAECEQAKEIVQEFQDCLSILKGETK